MDEYIKREDALKAIDRVRCEIHKPHEKYVIGELLMGVFDSAFDACDRGVNRIPAADVVKVVRCGECAYRNSGRPSCQGRRKDWFCPRGVRKGE